LLGAVLPKDTQNTLKLECGPMPNVMAALPNIGLGGASAQRRKVWLTPLLECRAVGLTPPV